MMMRLIDADALKKSFMDDCACECDICTHFRPDDDNHCGLINNAPTIEEKPKGKWIENDIPEDVDVPESVLSKCSVCGYQLGAHSFKFCPNCGARMENGDVTYE